MAGDKVTTLLVLVVVEVELELSVALSEEVLLAELLVEFSEEELSSVESLSELLFEVSLSEEAVSFEVVSFDAVLLDTVVSLLVSELASVVLFSFLDELLVTFEAVLFSSEVDVLSESVVLFYVEVLLSVELEIVLLSF